MPGRRLSAIVPVKGGIDLVRIKPSTPMLNGKVKFSLTFESAWTDSRYGSAKT